MEEAKEVADQLASKYEQSKQATTEAKEAHEKLSAKVAERMAELQADLHNQEKEVVVSQTALDTAVAKAEKSRAVHGVTASKATQESELAENLRAHVNTEDEKLGHLTKQVSQLGKAARKAEGEVRDLNKGLNPKAPKSDLDAAPGVDTI